MVPMDDEWDRKQECVFKGRSVLSRLLRDRGRMPPDGAVRATGCLGTRISSSSGTSTGMGRCRRRRSRRDRADRSGGPARKARITVGAPNPTTAREGQAVPSARISASRAPTTWRPAFRTSQRSGIRGRTDERDHARCFRGRLGSASGDARNAPNTSGPRASATARGGRGRARTARIGASALRSLLPSVTRGWQPNGTWPAMEGCRPER